MTTTTESPVDNGVIARHFRFSERNTDMRTEVLAGLTTFFVMAYIIFVNPTILSSGPLEGAGPPFNATLTATCLAAGIMCIVMGLATNYPFALAPGLGLNAVVAFQLILGLGLPWQAAMGIVFVWIGHALLPDSMACNAPQQAVKKEPPQPPDLLLARWSAFRSLAIVFPVAMWFVVSPNSAAYLAVMIKVASMGQQATNEDTRKAAKSLLLSTLIGGVGAVIAWQVLSIAPTLMLYTVIVALAGLVIGAKLFEGQGLRPQGPTWSYGYLTMLVILAPAVMDTSGAGAGAKFTDRLIMFVLATLYAVVAVNIVDAFRPKRVDRLIAAKLPGAAFWFTNHFDAGEAE